MLLLEIKAASWLTGCSRLLSVFCPDNDIWNLIKETYSASDRTLGTPDGESPIVLDRNLRHNYDDRSYSSMKLQYLIPLERNLVLRFAILILLERNLVLQFAILIPL